MRSWDTASFSPFLIINSPFLSSPSSSISGIYQREAAAAMTVLEMNRHVQQQPCVRVIPPVCLMHVPVLFAQNRTSKGGKQLLVLSPLNQKHISIHYAKQELFHL